MKKLINAPEDAVRECLGGFLAAHPDLVSVSLDPCFVARKTPDRNKVAVISGGGSGHEPMHCGFVGRGMLAAACPGAVFTSPSPDQMEAAARAVAGDGGVLFLVKNYSGDRMNFGMAAEMLAGGFRTATVVIEDDVAVKGAPPMAGHRGVGATVLAVKICGASAERGDPLDVVTAYAEYCGANGRSMGTALTSCTVPAAGRPTFAIGPDEIEMGVGIHGEPGRERMKLRPADRLVDMMFDAVSSDVPYGRGEESIVMVNGMGGTPLMELYICYNRVARLCAGKEIKIARCLVGNYVTALDMEGFSLTMLKADADILALWDAPVHTPGLRWGV